MSLVILDADGVFMDETPYWRTAVATALLHASLRVEGVEQWERIGQACLEEARLQRITKLRGCNSNWDFAAVLARALQDERRAATDSLRRQDYSNLAYVLARGMDALWHGAESATAPLSGFGIARDGPFFAEVVATFQDIFSGRRDCGWPYPRQVLAGDSRPALAALRTAGFTLGVCTSRGADEIVPPMTELGIVEFFDRQRFATHDDVVAAEEQSGVRPLGKPHWFPLAAAKWGREQAIAALMNGAWLHGQAAEATTYIGDALADFQCARACSERGLALRYVHVDSGVCNADDLAAIECCDMTLAVVENLSAAVHALQEAK